ncbi:MAG TPA: hybrid sensor histidine kinase/response regulator [Opitutaceae bacterium]|nr:hybrid sensor histidine kinase/response regulator [Opitutaceae bacterium]
MEQPARPNVPKPPGGKILIVDDDRINVRILGGILKTEGYLFTSADSGERALEVYREFQPDLVLLDVMMPGISGFDTCRKLRETHGDACAPVIFITAKNESDDVLEGLMAGGVDYLPKPFRPQEALARIGTHLHNRMLLGQLSKANAAKNKFLGMAAHDLRNPLATIRGLAEFLRDGTVGQLTADQLDLVNTIHEASQSMLAMVNDLLDVATIEAGELKISPEPCDLGQLVKKSVSLGNIEAARKQTTIVFEPPAAALMAPVDPAKIRQVIENLLSNAVKYSPRGSTITVTMVADTATCSVAVQDQGPGIPENERDRLFQDFGRLSAKPTGGEKSTGLGLAICRKIVEAHRGSIVANNLPARGCEFRITLPL